MTTPEFLPILSGGAHKDPKEGACFMEFASFLAGERWSDHPQCADPMLTSVAQKVNDSLPDADRQRLLPLIPRVIGTRQPEGTDTKVLHVRLACWSARQVLHLVPQQARGAAVAAVEAAEGWCRGEVSEQECRAAATAAYAYADAYADAYAAYAAARAAAAATAAYAYADAYADAAYAAAYAAARADDAAAYAAARAADAAADAAAAQVEFLVGLLDEFDRLTGRTQPEPLTTEQLRGMAELTA